MATVTLPLTQLRRVRWAVRAVLALAIGASIAGNVLHARDNPISQAIAAWPPLAFLLTVELISRVPIHRRWLAGFRLVAMAGIAGIAAWVSYWHQVAICARYGETGAAPYLIPLTVDWMVVVASVSLVELAARIRAVESVELETSGGLGTRVVAAPPAEASVSVPDATPHVSAPILDPPPVSIPPINGIEAQAATQKTDDELLKILRNKRRVPRDPDGTVPIRRAMEKLGCGQRRAKRLLDQAGLLRTGDSDEPVPVGADA